MDGIGRLRVVCLAERRTASVAFDVRSRLERVARSDLAPALDRQVGGHHSIRLDRLTVRLVLDPRDYDDPTLAVLWASRIREALEAADAAAIAVRATGAGEPAEAAMATAEGDGPGSVGSMPAAAAVVLARRTIGGDRVAAEELARAVVADPTGVSRQLKAQLSPVERAALVDVLGGPVAGGRPRARRVDTGRSLPRRRWSAAPRGSGLAARRGIVASSWRATLVTASRRRLARSGPLAQRDTHATTRDSRSAAARPAPEAVHDSSLVSRAAGLALLWPWLTAHLEAVGDRVPRIDPRHARRVALAALVPEVVEGVDDVVVRLLAGDDLADRPSLIVVTERELQRAADGTEAVLAAFAAAIPGFAGSTPAFVRREFLVRPGIIDPTTDPVAVRLAPMPLDPAVNRLPYPIAAFRLPWTGPIGLRMEVG